jgi:hypothetical protein
LGIACACGLSLKIGADHIKTRLVIKYESLHAEHGIVIDVSCILHGSHLIMRGGLELTDAWLGEQCVP